MGIEYKELNEEEIERMYELEDKVAELTNEYSDIIEGISIHNKIKELALGDSND